MSGTTLHAVAMQQVCYEGEYHTCMICLKFKDKDCNIVERHLEKAHSRILALIAEEQDSE